MSRPYGSTPDATAAGGAPGGPGTGSRVAIGAERHARSLRPRRATLRVVERADVLAIDPDPHTSTVSLALADGSEVTAPLHHAAVRPDVGDEVWVIRDDPDRADARIVLPPEEVLPELRAQGLLEDLDRDGFEALIRETYEAGEAPPGLDGPDILMVLYQRYGLEDPEQGLIEEAALERAIRDRILVFADAHDTPDLVEDAVAALADALLLDVLLVEDADANDVFDALGEATRRRSDHVFLLPMGVNEAAILVRDELAPSKLALFTEAERAE